MRRLLLVESLFDPAESLVEFLRPDHRPRDNIQLPRVKAGDEIGVLLVLNYPLELERESGLLLGGEGLLFLCHLLFLHFGLVRVNDILEWHRRSELWYLSQWNSATLMITKSVD
jgi:hypothetical protein